MNPSVQKVMPRAPRWLSLLFGVACLVVGLVLATRPFTSLSVLVALVAIAMGVTGIATLLRPASGASSAPARTVMGVIWIGAGITVAAWPDLSVRGLALIAGVVLIVGGLSEVIAAFRGTTDERLAGFVGGLARVIFGVLALSWPDVTVLVVAVWFGVATIVFGARTVLGALRGRAREPHPRGRLRRFNHVVGVSIVLVLALVLAGFSAKVHEETPVVDAFYTAPSNVPSNPGVLLRSEPFTRGIPSDARAWRILYTTTRDQDVPAVASGLVVIPANASNKPLPVVAWAHGTTGIASDCAPSLLADTFGSGALYSLDRVIANNWALVATDYIGLGTKGPHPYLIGQGEARSVLDAVRAAKQLHGVALAPQTIVWGHSQGGNAALWTGVLAPSYAPDVRVQGVAALAPASDLIGLVNNLRKVPGGSIFATYVLAAYSATYPDVHFDNYVIPTARLNVRKIADRCLGEPAVLGSVVTSLAGGFSVFENLAARPLLERLRQNTPTAHIAAPLLVAEGGSDPLVIPAVQNAYVAKLCAGGQAVDYRTIPGRDHVSLVEADSPLIPALVTWTRQRLRGLPDTSTCTR